MPWAFSGPARNELTQSHTAASRVDVIRGGQAVFSLAVVSGSVNTEAGRSVLSNMSSVVIDSTGQLSGSDANDLLNPYNCQVAPYRGVYVPSTGKYEYAPLGLYQLTGRTVSGDGSISLVGQDRSIIYQGAMTASLAIAANTPIESAIQQLLITRNRALQMRTWITGFKCGPLIFAPDIDVWKEAQTLAASVGGHLHHDRRGLLVFKPTLGHPRPVRTFSVGDGILLGTTRTEDSDTIHNVVTVEQEAGSAIRATVADTNPASPTYYLGKYGRRVVTIQNPHVSTVLQAQQAARTQLVYELGRSESVTITVVPDPTLDVMESITVNRPTADLANRGLVIESTTVPLGVTEAMTITCRKFILTENGQQVDAPQALTTS